MAYESLVRADPEKIFDEGSDLSRVYLKLGDVFYKLGFTEAEFRREAGSGRLIVRGHPREDGGYRDCVVSLADLFAWIRHPETPSRMVIKMTQHLRALRTLH